MNGMACIGRAACRSASVLRTLEQLAKPAACAPAAGSAALLAEMSAHVPWWSLVQRTAPGPRHGREQCCLGTHSTASTASPAAGALHDPLGAWPCSPCLLCCAAWVVRAESHRAGSPQASAAAARLHTRRHAQVCSPGCASALPWHRCARGGRRPADQQSPRSALHAARCRAIVAVLRAWLVSKHGRYSRPAAQERG